MDVRLIRTAARRGLVLILFGLGLFLPSSGWGQKSSSWRVYNVYDGLLESSSLGLNLSSRRTLWISHSEPGVLTCADGYEVKKFLINGAHEPRIYESRSGQIWALSPNGLQKFQNNAWRSYSFKEVPGWSQAGRQAPVLAPLRQSHVLCLLPDRLIEFDAEKGEVEGVTIVRQASQSGLEEFSDLISARDGGFWISGKKGLAKVASARPASPDNPWQEYLPASLDAENFQGPSEDDQGGVTMLAESRSGHKKLIVRFDGDNWSASPAPSQEIRRVWKGADNSMWGFTANALFELDPWRNGWRQNEEALAGQYLDVAVGPRGTFWLATSEGVYRYAALTWRSAGPEKTVLGSIAAAAADREDRIWFVESKAIILYQDEQWKRVPIPEGLVESFQPGETFCAVARGRLLAGNSRRLLAFDPKSERFELLAHPQGLPIKPVGALKDGGVCAQIQESGDSNAPIRLELYDGEGFHPFLTVPAKIHHGRPVGLVFGMDNSDLWLTVGNCVVQYRDQKWRVFDPSEERVPENIVCMLDLGESRVWCGTKDRIWEFDGREWKVIEAGPDRINGLLKTHDGSIWVASNSGIYRYYKGELTSNGIEEGLPSLSLRVLLEDKKGRIWAGTARGISLYHPEADIDPPHTLIQKPKGDATSPEGGATFSFAAQDKWKQTPPERLLYSYRLDEQDWSKWQSERSVNFPELGSGAHFFQVRAMDRNWNVEPTPALLEFTVPLPWYREARLVLIAFVGLAGAFFFAVLAFNRHRRLVRSYAEVERIVRLRTQELEVANRNLLQSQKMTALGTLAAGIAHDFNSILSIVKGSAQIIEANLERPEKIRLRVDRIKTAVDQGAGIVKAMLGFSRNDESKLGLCDLNVVVEETIRLLGDRFQRGTRIEFLSRPGLRPIAGAKDFIQQILLNFILNASEASQGSGKIVLRTGMMDQLPSSLVLHPTEAPCYAYIAVQDSGCGIEPETMPRIFEPFFTTKALSTKRGTGLGLSMVYQLAKEMGYGLNVVSAVGQGSTFTLVCPVDLATPKQ